MYEEGMGTNGAIRWAPCGCDNADYLGAPCLFLARPITEGPWGGGGGHSLYPLVPTAGSEQDASTMRAPCEAQSPASGL